jgi:uracil-DNA glycosylase family 4
MDVIGENGIHYPLPQLNSKCFKCTELVKSRKRITWGYGNPNSKVVMVGEAPGYLGADVTGIPFTKDNSGEYFQSILAKVGWDKDSVYVTNVVKCCPPGNRDPNSDEVDNCAMYLEYEITQVKPKYLVLMGKRAATYFHPTIGPFLAAWDRVYDNGLIAHVILPHPAFIVRNTKQWETYYIQSFKTIKSLVDFADKDQ